VETRDNGYVYDRLLKKTHRGMGTVWSRGRAPVRNLRTKSPRSLWSFT